MMITSRLSYSVKSLLILGFLFSWISWFTQSLEMKIQRTTVLSHYAELNTVGVYAMEVLSYETNK